MPWLSEAMKDPRGTGQTEGFLAAGLLDLVAAVMRSLNATHRFVSRDDLLALPLDGRDCIRNHSHCIGATRDSLYFDGTEPLFQGHHGRRLGIHNVSPQYVMTKDDVLVVCGVIHTRTGKATYVNVAPYFVEQELATGAVVDTKLEGSAAQYLRVPPSSASGAVDVDSLYAYTFQRDCGSQPYCYSVPYRGFPSIPLKANMTFVERVYLEPATRVGPLYTELQHPIVLHYTKQQQKQKQQPVQSAA
eukprot:TRINITY_DN14212_c2_g1_i1.p1 TRINITY_DN14212_c2_g1~~TRINITY_DN14212_c2_g1_i1.p1  ORF type:complete len:246 (+),score=42.43 TRINITY_DN14212_c2_g1_i1:99-836(+)